MPVYNGEAFLRDALDALLAQTFTDMEIVICDNASTDATEAICREYAEKDDRIRYFRADVNGGASRNFCRAFELARGKYFKWAAADDVCAPTFIESCVEVLERNETIVCCHSRTMKIDARGRRLTHLPDPTMQTGGGGRRLDGDSPRAERRFLDVLLSSGWSARSAGLIRSASLRRTRLIRPYYGWEKVLMGELALIGRFYDVPEVLFYQRIHENASSSLPTAAAQRRFFDPITPSRGRSPRLRLVHGHVSAVMRHPLPLTTRLACFAAIGRYLLQVSKYRRLLSRLKTGAGMSDAAQAELGAADRR